MKQGAKIEITVEEQGDHYAVRQEGNGSVGAFIAALASYRGLPPNYAGRPVRRMG